jgi:RimJ/RimL family protein N-acetyltransferase
MTSPPVLRDVPSALHTPRLLMRCPQPGDGAAVHAAVVDTLAALRQFPASLPWAMAEPSVAASEQFCRTAQADFLLRRNLPMLLFLHGSTQCIGSCGLHGLDWTVPRCEAGYWLRSGHTGQGLATETLNALTRLGLDVLGMRRIQALPDDANLASSRVCERASYALEGVLRHERADPDGRLRHTRVYAITG